jgi:hypothetical protein
VGRFLLLMSDPTVIEAFLFKLLWFCGAGSGESTDAERETSHCHSGHLQVQQFTLLCASRNRGLQESRPPLFFISESESLVTVPNLKTLKVVVMLERREPESTAQSRQSRPRRPVTATGWYVPEQEEESR